MKFSGPDQAVSSTEKLKLRGFLRRANGKNDAATEESAPRQITLKRRKVEEITVPAGKGKSTVVDEVRQKRTYVKRSEVAAPAEAERVDAQRKLDWSRAQQDGIDQAWQTGRAYVWTPITNAHTDSQSLLSKKNT